MLRLGELRDGSMGGIGAAERFFFPLPTGERHEEFTSIPRYVFEVVRGFVTFIQPFRYPNKKLKKFLDTWSESTMSDLRRAKGRASNIRYPSGERISYSVK